MSKLFRLTTLALSCIFTFFLIFVTIQNAYCAEGGIPGGQIAGPATVGTFVMTDNDAGGSDILFVGNCQSNTIFHEDSIDANTATLIGLGGVDELEGGVINFYLGSSLDLCRGSGDAVIYKVIGYDDSAIGVITARLVIMWKN